MGTLQINILGTSFTIKADEDSEYLNKLLRYYKGVTDTIEKKTDAYRSASDCNYGRNYDVRSGLSG